VRTWSAHVVTAGSQGEAQLDVAAQLGVDAQLGVEVQLDVGTQGVAQRDVVAQLGVDVQLDAGTQGVAHAPVEVPSCLRIPVLSRQCKPQTSETGSAHCHGDIMRG